MFSILATVEDEEGRHYSDRDVLDHLVFLMMAAHDTTSSTLTSMFYALAPRSRHMTFDDQEALPLTGLAMKESLRRYPPLPTIPRRGARACEFAGYRVPGNRLVAISPIHTHHMDKYWRAPFRFDPERFAEGRAEHKQHKYLWVPFGGGAQMCLGLHFAGMQVKAIFAQLLPRFRWDVPEGYEMPVRQVPISKPRDGLPLRLWRL